MRISCQVVARQLMNDTTRAFLLLLLGRRLFSSGRSPRYATKGNAVRNAVVQGAPEEKDWDK